MSAFRPFSFFTRRNLGHPFQSLVSTAKYLAAAHLFWEYGYSIGPAQGPSMLPTFEITDEWLLISKRHRHGRDVAVGDLVVYKIPIFPDSDGIKRVLGLPGDYVMIDSPESGSEAMIQVPKGHCWVVGDNLPASRDSRQFGPVPMALVRGKVIARAWPPWEFKWIENPLQSPDTSSEA
ncbi:LexA/Signal peptidase [Phialemonium atrogriseum]|uniref:LexA/Signal peptidase n=1 Tax=Phialemonium atrogriseum TaxID=1093897 RepID=A0AAJ0BXJ8_9PEZI|nr:LexA/Signal peptidase [Phialemonium atrogriseum]KAK1766126.1 LexA/Signal peptidase [Phialemonium atrogriseum]